MLNAMSRLREVYPHTLGLSFHQTLPSPSAILSQNPASLPPEELFDRFYQQVQQQELSEARKKLSKAHCGRSRRSCCSRKGGPG